MLITHLLLVLEVCNVKPTYRKSFAGNLLLWSDLKTNLEEIMGWESSDVVRFDLGPLLQGQMNKANVKSAYNSLIIDPRGLECETNL